MRAEGRGMSNNGLSASRLARPISSLIPHGARVAEQLLVGRLLDGVLALPGARHDVLFDQVDDLLLADRRLLRLLEGEGRARERRAAAGGAGQLDLRAREVLDLDQDVAT